MPEGPEVWALARAVNAYFHDNNINETVFSFGKQLIFTNAKESWSFGLNGTVTIDSYTKQIIKLNTGYVPGQVTSIVNLSMYKNSSVIDWLNATKEQLNTLVASFSKSKKMLGPLLLDLNIIVGIGVAWGSEILNKAELLPNVKAYQQNLSKLAEVMYNIGSEIRATYGFYVLEQVDIKQFILKWFRNLYAVRQMEVYKNGVSISVGGRNWWISNAVATVKSNAVATVTAKIATNKKDIILEEVDDL